MLETTKDLLPLGRRHANYEIENRKYYQVYLNFFPSDKISSSQKPQFAFFKILVEDSLERNKFWKQLHTLHKK